MKSYNYDAWNIKVSDFPSDKNTLEQTKFIARYGVLAPSVHNSQPWIFVIRNLLITIKPDYSKRLPQADTGDKFLHMSIGGCVESIEIAAKYFGFTSNHRVNSDNSVTITLKNYLKQEFKIHPDDITKRFSNKSPYHSKKIPTKILNEVVDNVSTDSVKLMFIQDVDIKSKFTNLHISAANQTLKNKQFVKELLDMLIPNNSKSYIGIPGFVSGMSNIKSHIIPKVIRAYPNILNHTVETKERELLKKSAGFGIIYTTKTGISSMIEAGGLYQKMSILLGLKHVHNTMLTAIIANDIERNKLKALLNIKDEPFLIFRFGYPVDKVIKHTPRKKI